MKKPKEALPFQEGDPALPSFQYLEDLACAYWHSEVLFAALDLDLFTLISEGMCDPDRIARAASCKPDELARFLRVLKALSLIGDNGGSLYNNPLAERFLVKSGPEYMGDFLLYRRYMKPSWEGIKGRISLGERTESLKIPDEDYDVRTRQYVAVMDTLISRKKDEICALVNRLAWDYPVLDVGGGAGSLLRAFVDAKEVGPATAKGVLYELPEVIKAAKTIYGDDLSWSWIETREGDFRTDEPRSDERFGLIIMSNVLHAYGAAEAERIVAKAVRMLEKGGLVLVHDYFPDRVGSSPQKGAFYDLNMMLNTYNGVCHESSTVAQWLGANGLSWVEIFDLTSDTSVILARAETPGKEETDMLLTGERALKRWEYYGRDEGFEKAVLIPAGDVIVAPWVALKCRYGCPRYGKNLRCPPHSVPPEETARIIDSYRWALVLEGTPPGRQFHTRLLALERRAFLDGYHKAFAFGAGPCEICEACPDDGRCRHPDLVRPSMEGAGIDVFGTVSKAGISLKPVQDREGYVRYLGLLLLE